MKPMSSDSPELASKPWEGLSQVPRKVRFLRSAEGNSISGDFTGDQPSTPNPPQKHSPTELNAEAAAVINSMPSLALPPRRARVPREQVIYFLRGGGLIKVGTTDQLRARIRGIQSMSPVRLDLIMVAPGDVEREEIIHQRLQHSRHHGEWFEPSDALIRVMWMAAENGRRWRALRPQLEPALRAAVRAMRAMHSANKAIENAASEERFRNAPFMRWLRAGGHS